jgi:predicted benzoate:H+ symporter BenE
MEAENVRQGYPLAYVLPSMLAQTFVVCGIFLFALNMIGEFARIWQWLFPLLVAELVAGMIVDLTHAADALGIIPDELFSVWFVAPAYYFNFKVARYRR